MGDVDPRLFRDRFKGIENHAIRIRPKIAAALNNGEIPFNITEKVIAVTSLVTLLNLIREKFALVSLIRRPPIAITILSDFQLMKSVSPRGETRRTARPRVIIALIMRSQILRASVVSRH